MAEQTVVWILLIAYVVGGFLAKFGPPLLAGACLVYLTVSWLRRA